MGEWLHHAFKALGVRWYVSFGTLLGSVRNASHIDYEKDIDITVDLDDWDVHAELLASVVTKHSHYVLDTLEYPARLKFSSTNSVHVNIWFFAQLSEGSAAT